MCRCDSAHSAAAITMWRRYETQEATSVVDRTTYQELLQVLGRSLVRVLVLLLCQ